MKRILVLLASLAICLGLGAQTMYDGMEFCKNVPFGTARSIALGNAVTALGGDLGSVSINPAGSAVSPYAQVAVSPALNISVVNSSYSTSGDAAFGSPSKTTSTKFNMPQFGVTMNVRTGNKSGLKSFSFGILTSQTANYNNRSIAYGRNSQTSMQAELASSSYGISEDILKEYDSFNNSDVHWDLLTGYQAGMFTSYDNPGAYVASSQRISPDNTYCYVPGQLSQVWERSYSGIKNDVVLNLGANINDKLYVGVNVGLPTARYRYNQYFTESAVSPDQFPIIFNVGKEKVTTLFKNAEMDYSYYASISGFYGRFGAIYLPVEHLRLGLAFQTPSAYNVYEEYSYHGASTFEDVNFNYSESSPLGAFRYRIRTPYIVDLGIAYTFGSRGLLSVDYELMDYHIMEFRDTDRSYRYNDSFRKVNSANSKFCGQSHSLRVGAEIKVVPQVSLRAGYSFCTSPERYWINNLGEEVTADYYLLEYDLYSARTKNLVTPIYYGDRSNMFSAGIGYSSNGSFFADAAVRFVSNPAKVDSPYYAYDDYDSTGTCLVSAAPCVKTVQRVYDIVLTLGWRF